jgi:hypothetical protein
MYCIITLILEHGSKLSKYPNWRWLAIFAIQTQSFRCIFPKTDKEAVLLQQIKFFVSFDKKLFLHHLKKKNFYFISFLAAVSFFRRLWRI